MWDKTSATIVVLFAARSRVENAVNKLKWAGFRNSDISVLIPCNVSVTAPDYVVRCAGAGAIFGGTLGCLVHILTLTIPRIGLINAAGPLAQVLAGSPGEGPVNGISEALMDMGVPGYESARYEGRVKHGSFLLSVHCDNYKWTNMAERFLRDSGGEDFCSTSDPAAYQKPEASYTQV